MSRTEIALPTPDGDSRAFVFKPDSGSGPWPAAIIAMDAPAIRPALFEMGERLAAAGYYVLLPDLFWRAGPYPPLDIAAARAGDKEAGATVHIVTEGVDEGPVLAQTRVPILANDNASALQERVKVAEHRLYPEALAAFCRRLQA